MEVGRRKLRPTAFYATSTTPSRSSKDQPGRLSGLDVFSPDSVAHGGLWLNLNTCSSADFRADVTAGIEKRYCVVEAVGMSEYAIFPKLNCERKRGFF